MNHILEADGIMLDFDRRRILSNIYLRCETGKTTGILGRNGEGKSCLLNIIYGSLNAISKSIRFDNISIAKAFKYPELLTYLPQFSFIPEYLSIRRVFSDFNLDYKEFENMFPEFLSKYNNIDIKNLSGGQKRLIEVYVIIKSKSQFSMLDEPFSHLTPLQIEKIKDIIKGENTQKGFLITDHLYHYVTEISDNLYVLSGGTTYLTKDITDIEKFGYVKL